MVDNKTIRKAVNHTAPKYHIRSVALFGSYARGDNTNSSDIDLVLETDSGFSLFDAAAFRREIMDILKLEVDIVSRNALSGLLHDEISKEEILLYERA